MPRKSEDKKAKRKGKAVGKAIVSYDGFCFVYHLSMFLLKKMYAVFAGRQKGIFDTWEECKKYVHGFKGARYKKFRNLPAAKYFARHGHERRSRKITSFFKRDELKCNTNMNKTLMDNCT